MTAQRQSPKGVPDAISAWLNDDPDGGTASAPRVFALTLGILLVVFGATANWTFATNDPLTNAIAGWYLGNEGTVILDRHEDILPHRTTVAWVVESPRGPVSQYPPGTSAVAAAAYALTPGDLRPVLVAGTTDGRDIEVLQPPIWPATLTAVLVTALACSILALVYLDIGGTASRVVGAGVLSGLATGAWSVASNMAWTHGPAMLCIAAGVWAASKNRWWLSGLAFGAGILVRPHVAVIAAVLGLYLAMRRRRALPAIGIGTGSAVGLGGLLLYNHHLFGSWTISAGYGGDFANNLFSTDVVWFVRNVVLGLVSPVNGLLVWAPFLVLLAVEGWRSRRVTPDWATAAAIGGALYLMVQWKANRYTGGAAYFAYRYPLETLVAVAPWLWSGSATGLKQTPTRFLKMLLVIGVTGQAVGAVLG